MALKHRPIGHGFGIGGWDIGRVPGASRITSQDARTSYLVKCHFFTTRCTFNCSTSKGEALRWITGEGRRRGFAGAYLVAGPT